MPHSPLFRHCLRLLRQSVSQPKTATSGASVSRLTRRRFIRSTALVGGTAIATRLLSTPAATQAQSSGATPAIAIVGAGLAGLNAAYQLKNLGLSATVYEAKPQVGGRTPSVTGPVGPGLVLDPGGHFINSDHDDILSLADELGLPLFNRVEDAERSPIAATSYYFDGRLRPEAEVAASLAPIAQQIADDAALLDDDYDQFAPEFDELSVADYLDLHADKIAGPFVRTLLEQSIRTEYGVEPEDSSALQLLFNLPTVDGDSVEMLSSDETYTMEGGIGRLVDSLAAALPGQIHTSRRLTRLQSQNSGFRLTFNGAETVDADYVILAIPFTVLRRVDLHVDLPKDLTRFIHEVDLGANEKLFAGFNQKVWRQSGGFINEIWTDQGYSQAWESTQRQPDSQAGALTFYLGGEDAITAQATPAAAQGQAFVQGLGDAMAPQGRSLTITDLPAAANGQFFRTAWSQDPFAQGAYTSFQPGQLTEFAEFFYIEADTPDDRQDVYVDNLVFAGEHLSDEFYGYMNGAAQTGRLATEVVAERVLEGSGGPGSRGAGEPGSRGAREPIYLFAA
ncbi:MAG: FAD-dependent oxidoreductase [Kaiparowitsia implicata GSE-PSE-MK54-09C]|nr:FAD-dependent oxidoreductase [Kaiparowitsia implicata GSE-PSE-MK54-09C]